MQEFNSMMVKDEKSELAEFMGRPNLDIRLIMAIAGDRTLNAREKAILDELARERGEGLFSDMLYTLTHKTFPSRQAKQLWDDILKHRGRLKSQLGRDAGLSVSAHDYLSNVSGLLKNVSMIEEGKMSSLANIANRDGLTGLFDQATFKHKLKEELERQSRYGGALSLVMLDIDHFKRVNDTLGHAEGDIILKGVADTLSSSVRKMDTAARYGGEEFAVILPEVELGAAYIFAERLRQKTESTFENHELKITISLGIASSVSDVEITSDEFIRQADEQLYCAKNNGRNQVCYKAD